MIEILNWVHEASQWIILITATGIIGFIGKMFYEAWKDIKTTLKHFAEAANQFALTVADQRKDLDTLNKKVDSHSEKFKDQDRKFEDQDKRIDALEVSHAVIKTTCELHHMKGGEG